jgi:cytochrome c556
MRVFTICTTIALAALMGTMVMAQGAPSKIASMADYQALMKSNGAANGALNKALGSGAFADARMQVTTLQQNLRTLQAFWKEHKNMEAVKIVGGGLMSLADLDKMLAAPAPDQMAAQAAAKMFGGNTCGACHKMMREGDAQSGFRFMASANPF